MTLATPTPSTMQSSQLVRTMNTLIGKKGAEIEWRLGCETPVERIVHI